MNPWTKSRFSVRILPAAIVESAMRLGLAALLFSAIPVMAAPASAPEPVCPQISLLQQRLIEKAVQGPAELHRFVAITKSVHGLDFVEVVEWLDATRERFAACQPRASSGEPGFSGPMGGQSDLG
ncbi:MAG: hypothetical protein ACJ8G7_05780 [Rhizobacter sp.]